MIGQHLDYDVLADLAEGLLDDETAAAVREHLDDCPECRDRAADLAHVSQLLAAAPSPAMPESLAARLDEAILAESAHRPVVDLAARRRVRTFQFLAAAAAVVAVSGVGVGMARTALDEASSSDSKAAATAPQVNTRAEPLPGSEAAAFVAVSSGTDYRRDTLAAQVADQLGQGDDRGVVRLPSSALASCVGNVADGRRTLFVDIARFEGKPATIIVLQPATGPDTVLIAGPACSATEKDILDQAQLPA